MKTKMEYVMKKVNINRDNLSNYELYDNRRKIRVGQVRKLLAVLKANQNFPPISVNLKNNKKYILDGNHRYEAIRQYLEYNNDSINLWEIQFKIDNIDEENNTFVALNDSINTSADDLLNLYKDHPFIKKLLNIPCVSTYGSETKPIKIKVLLNAYVLASSEKYMSRSYRATELLNKCDYFNDADLKYIIAFLKDYEYIFGSLQTKQNIWLKTPLLTAMFRIWYQNKHVDINTMTRKFRFLINHPSVLEFSRQAGRDAIYNCTIQLLGILNMKVGQKFVL